MTTRVVNCKGGNRNYDVYSGRWNYQIRESSKWRNPFPAKKYGREKCIEMYREYIMNRPELLSLIPIELKGKVLGCWCKPEKCHGDILVELKLQYLILCNLQFFFF
jgi:Domain of unknown function (DUF4326)